MTGMEIAKRSGNEENRNLGISSAESLVRKSLLMVKQVQLLSKVRYTEPRLERIRICEMMVDYGEKFKALFPNRDLDLRFSGPEECKPILAEPMIEAMFFNLLHNAIKFQDGKNAIVEMNVNETDEELQIEISDQGSGIPDELKDKIFGKFEMFGQKGRVGLGLSLVEVLVDRYKGSIEVMDRIEGDHTQGTKFLLKFPLAAG